tara:strand:+ start:829 stop:1065 length:237 start_codon:yes stop_codon:yes gene_type:complete
VKTRAFILIETAVGKTREVADILKGVENITSLDLVTGPHDIITIVEAPDIISIGDLVTSEIHTISGVLKTVTCIGVGK